MRVRFLKEVRRQKGDREVVMHAEGSIMDLGIAQAAQYCDEEIAAPADEQAAEFLEKWQSQPEEVRKKFATTTREITFGDDGAALEAVR